MEQVNIQKHQEKGRKQELAQDVAAAAEVQR